MFRPSRVLWIVAVVLLLLGLLSCVQGFALLASLIRGTDVDRDIAFAPVQQLIDAGAVDLDKTASVMGLSAYRGKTPTERQAFEEAVREQLVSFTTDPVELRAQKHIKNGSSPICLSGVVTLVLAMLVGWQAYRVGDIGG